MILVLDKHDFEAGKLVSGEVSASGHHCCLVLKLTCTQKLKIQHEPENKKKHKTSIFRIFENLTEPESSFENITFPFTFRLSADFPSTLHLFYTTPEGMSIEVSLKYKIKVKLIQNNQELLSASQEYTVIGRPVGQANFSVAEINQPLIYCLPLSISIRLQVPVFIKLGDSAKNFRVTCTQVPKHCRILSIEGRIQYKAKIMTEKGENLVNIKKDLQKAKSNGDDFSMIAAIEPLYGKNNCSYCSDLAVSKYQFCVTVFYRFCCKVKRLETKLCLNVIPKNAPGPSIEVLPPEYTLHQLRTIELKNRLRGFNTASYRKTAATIDSESVFFQ